MSNLSLLFVFGWLLASIVHPGTPPDLLEEEIYYEIEDETSYEVYEEEPIDSNIELLIPDGWRPSKNWAGDFILAYGDLNSDELSDIAIIVEEEITTQDSRRALVVGFGQEDVTYSLSMVSENLVLYANEGGVWGDPLDSLTIDKGSLVVSHFGGSNWRWHHTVRVRYQDNDWRIIGITIGSYFTGTLTQDEEDYNLLTGDYVIKNYDEHGNENIIQGNSDNIRSITVDEFNIRDIEALEFRITEQ